MIEEPAMMTESKQAETGQMKAIVRERFGSPDVLQLKEIEKPAPNDVRGVLVKVYASSVNPADRYDVNGMSFALRLLRSEEHTSELQSLTNLVCRLLLEKKKDNPITERKNNNHTL